LRTINLQILPHSISRRLTMKFAHRLCLFALMFVSTAALAQAQTGTITGVVTDNSGKQPLPGARVTVTGTSLAASTTDDGRFTIRGVPAGAQQVRIQRIGFAPLTRTVTVRDGETSTVSAELIAQATQLSTVVAIGYGTQL